MCAITLLTFYQNYQAQSSLCDDSESKLFTFPPTNHMIALCNPYWSCKNLISCHFYDIAMAGGGGADAVIFIFHINKSESANSKPSMTLPFSMCMSVHMFVGIHVERWSWYQGSSYITLHFVYWGRILPQTWSLLSLASVASQFTQRSSAPASQVLGW